jgi:hypothetical protein
MPKYTPAFLCHFLLHGSSWVPISTILHFVEETASRLGNDLGTLFDPVIFQSKINKAPFGSFCGWGTKIVTYREILGRFLVSDTHTLLGKCVISCSEYLK